LGVVVTATGQLIGFDLNDLAGSVGVVFTPPVGEEVAAVEALADGHVVAVLSTGEVVDLAPSGGGLAVDATFVPQTGGAPGCPAHTTSPSATLSSSDGAAYGLT
jgi:hypothetical protein